ncbi:Muniscin C-terminal mu homology domain-containing protein [Amylocarpus encephaloides]|uniref:Muniscin C-terminal mu homology domain-containing protein n=1 Tax=Amylocarpus encephaloides TaxID=45428 RepID=A0A9P8C031_9HELO|nr:Muniscin C-terminal mu homology domain-containing protein [Amylocarpus encephaloides]
MEALSRQEYPAMLERLEPSNAVTKFNERVKKIGKTNSEIADWLQERRKVEDAYVAGLKKLVKRPLQEVGHDLGVFDIPWKKIVASTEEVANSHYTLLQRIEKDVEQPLRTFTSTNREMQQLQTIQGNLSSMAKELSDAQERSDKLSRKGGKASAAKVDAAAVKLQGAEQQWNSQAPFVFETLQAIDERRLNHLRDVLTQLETHQADQIERNRVAVEHTLSSLLEVDTNQDIRNWSHVGTAGKPITERRARQLSTAESATTNTSMPPPPTPRSTHTDAHSEHSNRNEKHEKGPEKENLKSRFGTMLGRRRQSIHGSLPSFGRAPSPSKGGFVPFGGRNSASRDGRPSPSPRASSNNLRESPSRDNRLSSLAESPPQMSKTSPTNGTNGVSAESSNLSGMMPSRPRTSAANGSASAELSDLSQIEPPPGPPPSHLKENSKDAEGFTVPAAMNDPISQAQQEAAQEGEQPQFKLDIRPDPIMEQDDDAQAALSNVANTLRSSQLATPGRKVGTVRGRRDVRNTIFVPSTSTLPNSFDIAPPPSPGFLSSKNAAVAALSSSEHRTAPSVSDTTSIRSGHSLMNHALVKHVDMQNVGLNASIIETISATFDQGVVKTSKISGEIALVYNKTTEDDSPLPPEKETIRINNFPNLEAIGPNRTFIHPVSTEKSDQFTVNLAPISSKSSIGFTYKVHSDDPSVINQGPLIMKPAWQQLSDKLQLLVEYSLNPESGLESISFNNLMIIAYHDGARATKVQTKPSGTHMKEKSLVGWKLGNVTLGSQPHKVICRFIGAEGNVPTPGRIEARWETQSLASIHSFGSGISLSRLDVSKGKERELPNSDDPFADEGGASPALQPQTPGTWTEIETSRKYISGKYESWS